MANDVRIDLIVRGERQAKQALKDVGDSAEKAGTGLEHMGKDAGQLDKQLEQLRKSHSDLIKEFDKTGDFDLVKKIKADSRKIRLFEGLKKELQKELDEAAAQAQLSASNIGKNMATEIVQSAATKPVLIGVLVGAAATVAPFLGGVIASAVLGAAGAGGLIGGFALATRDQRVKDAASELGHTALDAFTNAASSFVGPAVESLGHLENAALDVSSQMEKGFRAIAPVLVPFVDGLAGFVDDFMPGFVAGLEEAKPVIRVIAKELPDIGHALGDMIETMGKDSDGAVLAFSALSKVIQATLRGFGDWVAGLSMAYEWSVRTGAAATGAMEDVFGWLSAISFSGVFKLAADGMANENDQLESLLQRLHEAGDTSHDFSGNLGEMGSIAKQSADEIEGLQNAIDGLFGNVMDLDRATIAYEKSLDDLTEAVGKNGRTLDPRTEQGRAVRGTILDEVDAIKQLRDSNIQSGMAVSDANALYEQQIDALRRSAEKLGLNKKQVDELVNAFKGLPSKAQIEISAPGLLEAIARAKELARLLGSTSAAANAAGGGTYVSGRAGGGPVMAGQTYVVGENGPEVLKMGANGGYVYSAGSGPTSAGVMSGASGGAARAVVSDSGVSSGDTGKDALVNWLWPEFLRRVRVNGGLV